jgi:toxin-antitoxin system PIN domain toxin
MVSLPNSGWLLDGCVLAPLALSTHPHHEKARQWFASTRPAPFATCAITQGTLLRLSMQVTASPSAASAWATLRSICTHPDHVFWDDAFSYLEIAPAGLLGHRQVTDAWLAQLARRRGGRVATLDAAFAQTHPDVATLI